ncbi:MAG: hypothetical protein WAL98_17750 [Desulfatiglandaceae bacterium]
MALDGGSGRGGVNIAVWKKTDCCLDQSRLFHQKVSPPVGCPVGVKARIMSWGSQPPVLEPESLRDEIQAEAMAILD